MSLVYRQAVELFQDKILKCLEGSNLTTNVIFYMGKPNLKMADTNFLEIRREFQPEIVILAECGNIPNCIHRRKDQSSFTYKTSIV